MSVQGRGILQEVGEGKMIPDVYDLWEAHEREQEKSLLRLPQCDNPGCRHGIIQDEHYFYIDGEILCQECMEDKYMFRTEDYCDG